MTNKEIVMQFLEQVVNQKRIDLYETYVSPDCIGHNAPYVGVGIWFGPYLEPGKVIIKEVAAGGPADGILLPGDEVISITDDNKTLSTFEELNSSSVGPGVIGTIVKYQVRREGQEYHFELQRGIIPGFDIHWKKTDFANFFQHICSDLHFEIKMMIEEGDIVAYYGVDSGTWLETGRSVVFGELGMYRVKDGKITESWELTDDASRMRQEGYQILAPEKIRVP